MSSQNRAKKIPAGRNARVLANPLRHVFRQRKPATPARRVAAERHDRPRFQEYDDRRELPFSESEDEVSYRHHGRARSYSDEDNDPPAYPCEDDEQNKILGHSEKPLDSDDVVTWLIKAENAGAYSDKVMTVPPVKPRGGDILLYKCRNKKDTDHHRDQYQGFYMDGTNKQVRHPVLKKYFKLKDADGHVTEFRKFTYELRGSENKDDKMVLIHYTGPESSWEPRPHGLTKSGQQFTSTSKQARDNIAESLSATGGKSTRVYESLVDQYAKTGDPAREKVSVARNRRQVENEKARADREKKVMRCEIFAIIEMAKNETLGAFIVKHVVSPFNLVILAEPQAIKLANKLLKAAVNDPATPQLVTYDTTFRLGKAYVSTIVMRNTFMRKNPIFPVMYGVHDRRPTEVHMEFWSQAKSMLFLEACEQNVPLCTDREDAIVNSILFHVPKCRFVHCTNHMKQNVRWWVKNAGGQKDDLKVLHEHVQALIHSESEKELDEYYETVRSMWSQPFKHYADQHLIRDIKERAARYYTKQFPAFDSIEATSNQSESLNAIIQNREGWSLNGVDSLVLQLFNLQLHYLSEFDRAYRETGNFVRKDSFKGTKCPFKMPDYAHWSQLEFVKFFKEGIYLPDENIVKEGEYLTSRKALAKMACEKNLVSVDSKAGLFHVGGVYNRRGATVERKPDGTLSCTCKSTGFCFHRIAVLYCMRIDIEYDDYSYSLSVLNKKTRNFQPGRKQPQAGEYIVNVNPSADSDIMKKRDQMDDIYSDGEGIIEVESDKEVGLSSHDDNEGFAGASSNEEEEGIHHYSAVASDLPASNDDCISFSSRRSVASEAETPAKFLFGNVPENMSDVYSALVKTPTYSCLKERKWLAEDVVNDFISFLIKIHDAEEKIAFINSYEFRGMMSKGDHGAISTAARCEGLNSDIVLINILFRNHFVLGVLLFGQKEVIIINSMLGQPPDMTSLIRPLLKLVAASLIIANVPCNLKDWKVTYENEICIQDNSYDCGIFTCLNAYNIVRKEKFVDAAHSPESIAVRRWILFCLISDEAGGSPIYLRKYKKPTRIPVAERQKFTSLLGKVDIPQVVPLESSRYVMIRDELRRSTSSWETCGAAECKGSHEGQVGWLFCVVCRKWFFSGSCVPAVDPPITYYFCPQCNNGEQNGKN